MMQQIIEQPRHTTADEVAQSIQFTRAPSDINQDHEEALTIHELYRAIELSDLDRIGRWQDEQAASGMGLRIRDFLGRTAQGAVHPYDFALRTSGCRLHFRLAGPLGSVSLNADTFSRMSLVRLHEQAE